GRARRRRRGRRRPALRPVARAAPLPVQPSGHDLRRREPDPTQRDRRASARPPPRAAMTAPPEYPTGHGLLDDRVVVVTAAAGSGIGFATARRCAEEGATVVLSDHHARRLDEAAATLAEELGRRPLAVVCDVTKEEDVQRLLDAAAAEHGAVDVMVNNAG